MNSQPQGASAQKKSVKFSTNVISQVRYVPSLSEMTTEHISSLWTTKDDERKTMLDAKRNIQFLRQGSGNMFHERNICSIAEHESRGYCARGLESMQSRNILELNEMKKQLVRDSVLYEQRRQRGVGGKIDSDRIAATSAEVSGWARDRAVERAAGDAAYVQQHVRGSMMNTDAYGLYDVALQHVTDSLQAAASLPFYQQQEDDDAKPATVHQNLNKKRKLSRALPTSKRTTFGLFGSLPADYSYRSCIAASTASIRNHSRPKFSMNPSA